MPETTLSQPEAPTYKYWAFISYSQRDKNWSDWLHRSIETYRVPRRLVGRRSRDGKVPPRLFPVFRDREELPTSANLNSNIDEALRASRYLIVVCSPHAATSRWVNEEIRAFKAMGGEDRILAIIVDGEPNASDKPSSGVPECFPEAIRYRVGADGNLTQERTEPIAADVRPDRDGRDNARLKILSGLLGVGFDELRQRDRQLRRRRRVMVIAAAIAMIAALVGTWLVQEHAKTRDVARQLASKYDERARRLAEKGDEAGAALYFAEANRLRPERARRDAALFHIQKLVLPQLRVEHGEKITCVAFDPTGRRFLTMSNEGTLRVWDAQSGVRLVQFHVDNDTGYFGRAVFTRDGKRIFTALENARLWDTETGNPIAPAIPFKTITLGGGGVTEFSYVDHAALDFSEEKVVLKWNVDFFQLWDADTSKPLGNPEPHTGEWADLAFLWQNEPIPKFSPDAKISVVTGYYDTIELVNVASGKKIGGPIRQEGGIVAAAFSPNSEFLATGGPDGTAHLWRVETARSFTPMIHPDTVSIINFSPDGAFILTASGATAYLWNSSCQLEMVMPNSAAIIAATFSADSQSILTGTEDGRAFVWKVAERRSLPRSIAYDGWKGARLMILSPDGRSLFTQRQHIHLWDVRSGAPLWNPVEHQPGITTVAFSPDRSTIATVDHAPIPRAGSYEFGESVPEKKTFRLWDAKTGAAVGDGYEISERGGGDSDTPETVIAFGADGKRVLLIHNTYRPSREGDDGLTPQATLQLLEGRTGRPLGERLTIAGHVHSALFLQSGEILLARDDVLPIVHHPGAVLHWPMGRSEPSADPFLQIEGIRSIALSPDEKTLLTVTTNSGRLWDMQSRQPIGVILQKPGMTEIHNAAFSPDGRIALTTDEEIVRLWDARTGEAIGQPFSLGEVPMFGQTPRFVDGAHLLSPGRFVVWDKDLSWLLRDASPATILFEARHFSRRQVKPGGASEIIPAAQWNTMRR